MTGYRQIADIIPTCVGDSIVSTDYGDSARPTYVSYLVLFTLAATVASFHHGLLGQGLRAPRRESREEDLPQWADMQRYVACLNNHPRS